MTPTPTAGAVPAGTAVIFFTDIASSTALTERMGDAAFRAASGALDERLRAAIRDAGGTPVEGKVMGDGVMATFTSAREAIDAALRCAALSAESELRLHIGIHAGDVIREPDNVFGGAVNIASRICDASAPGEVLVSDVVRGMARTSAGVTFEDRGEREMKGVGDPVRVYAVRSDAGEQNARHRLALPLLAVIALIAAGVGVGAVVLVFALSGEGEGDDGEPQYTEIHIRSAAADVTPYEVTGDCVTTPLVIKGRLEALFTGDISGAFSAQYEVVYSLADQCNSFSTSGTGVMTVDDGSTLSDVNRSFSVNLLSFESAARSDAILAGITTSGTGVYAGVSGRGVCRISLLLASEGPRANKADIDCTIKLAPRVSLPPIIFQPIANAEKVTTQLAPSSRGDTFKILLLYFNTRDEPQSGLSVRLPVLSGARISSSAGEGDSMIEGPREWELPDLAPGEVASFEITVRLLSAEGDSITLRPEIAMQGRKHTFKSDPIVIAVER